MPFITVEQMKSHIYPGVSNIISQGDQNFLKDAISAAIAEAKGYCSRYRVEQLFDNVDMNPEWLADPILMMHVKNMAKWHFIVLANPAIDYEDAQNRYDQAVKWLTNIQSGKVVQPGWQLAQPEAEKGTFFHVSSNKKRKNHF
jgi:phage gp36-like protein